MLIDYSAFTETPVKNLQELLHDILHPEWEHWYRTSKRGTRPALGGKVTASRSNRSNRPKSMPGYLWGLLNQQGESSKSSPGINTQTSEPPAPIPIQNQTPPLHALIIGINDYKNDHVTNLSGAVPDAKAFQEFLEKGLGVPSSQIRSLHNAQATRAKIIEALRGLESDDKIMSGDPIVIFYAGHGGETKAPIGWEGDKMQMLIPHDFRSPLNVHGIPDRSVNALLTDLAKAKGDNITVIFDCSHSDSSTRESAIDPSRMSRVTQVPDDVPVDLDQDIWRTTASGAGGTQAPAGFAYQGLKSHVLLTACREEETAKEENGRGMFTQALLNEIAIVGVDKTTYNDLFQRIPSLPEQSPQCGGYSAGRILFNAKVSSPQRVFYTVQRNGDKYVMSAGAAHGVTDGAEFTVYQDNSSPPTAPPLGILVVFEAKAFESAMDVPEGSPKFPIPQPAYAIQTKTGAEEDLRLHVVMDEKLRGVFHKLAEEMQTTGADRRRMLLVEKDQADLDIQLENGKVVFNIQNKLVTQFGLTRMPHCVLPNVDDVFPVIRAAAHFQWHLRRTNHKGILQKGVRIEAYMVEKKPGDDGVIIATGKNLNCGGVVDVVGSDKAYGFKIINDTRFALYPALFYFDNSDLSITSYYQTLVKGNTAPLLAGGSLTVGYGSGGSSPNSFVLPPGQKIDVGFLKLFLSTEHIDHSNIPQHSPFNTGTRGAQKAQPKTTPKWDTIFLTVVIR